MKLHAPQRICVALLFLGACAQIKDPQNSSSLEPFSLIEPGATPTGDFVQTPENEQELCQTLANVHTDPGEIPQLSTKVGEKEQKLPLKHTDVKAELSGFIAKVEVTQTYKNDFSTPIEANYIFPLPENSAVFAMEMKIGDRIIFSEIKKREEARSIYENAKKDGYTAALLEQQRPNIFTQSVANIEPGKEIQVTIRYTQDLSYDAGYYEFVFPMVVGPRFFAPSKAGGKPTPAEPGPDAVNPPLLGDGVRPGNDVSISVVLRKAGSVKEFKVPTHEVKVAQYSTGDVAFSLSNKDEIPNRDFVLRYRVGGQEPQVSVLAHKGNRGGFFSLVVQPPELNLKELVGDRELIFVVDISGSMGGKPLAMCKDAMREALLQLRPVDTFNILTFAGATEWAFKAPRPANTANVAEALSFIDKLMAGGGTYMLNAVNAALRPEIESGRNRYVFFMTDGYVGQEQEIIAASGELTKAAEAKGKKSKVFGFGVGGAPNRNLMEGLATAGKGLTVYASTREDPVRAVNQFYRYIDHSVWEDVSIDWNGLAVEEVQPEILPDLFVSRPMIIHGRYQEGGKKTITIKGKAEGKEISVPVKIELPTEEPRNSILATLWARAKISSLSRRLYDGTSQEVVDEITNLGLTYHLVTQYTSLVAVDRSQKVSDGDPTRIDQAVPTPEGTSAANFGAAYTTPTTPYPTVSPSPMAPSPAASPKEPKLAPRTNSKDEVDDLLGGKSSGGAESSAPSGLSSSEIAAVMSKANFSSCKTIGTGKVQLKITIDSKGSVTSATGDGSPLATCVVGVVKKLKFPMIVSPSQTFPYPVYIKE